MAEICVCDRAGEFVRQQGQKCHHVSLLDHLRALRALAADHHVDRHFAVGIQRKIEGLELVVSGELFVEASFRIEASDDPRACVVPVGEFLIAEREQSAA